MFKKENLQTHLPALTRYLHPFYKHLQLHLIAVVSDFEPNKILQDISEDT